MAKRKTKRVARAKSAKASRKKKPATRKTTKRKTTLRKKAVRTRAASAKVGSSRRAARKLGGKGDFGVPEGRRRERDYASRETKMNDPGAAPDRIKIGDSARESGAGAPESGRGSGSGGDVDTDVIGVGSGQGISESGPDERETGPDMTTEGGSEPFAAPGPKGHRGKRVRSRVLGTTVDRSGGDITTTGDGQSAGSVTNPMAQNEDSFAADVELDEATGEDQARGGGG